MQKSPSVFLSYCWANHAQTEEIYNDLRQIGIFVKKDNQEIALRTESLTFYMRIGVYFSVFPKNRNPAII